jgi:hypothetical protein
VPFKPKRTVTGPHGTWEIYVSKYIGVLEDERRRNEERERRREMLVTAEEGAAFAAQVESGSLFGDLFGRKKSHAIKIEAINWGPPDEKLVWTTTDEAVDRVLDEIAEGFRQGKVVQPEGAVYSGAVDEISPDGMVRP